MVADDGCDGAGHVADSNLQVIEDLLKAGVNAKAKDKGGDTASDLSKQNTSHGPAYRKYIEDLLGNTQAELAHPAQPTAGIQNL